MSDCLTLSIYNVRPDITLRKNSKLAVWDACISYIMQLINFSQLKKRLGDEFYFSPRDYIDIRSELSQKYQTCLAIKMAIINWVAGNYTTRKKAKQICKDNDLPICNYKILITLDKLPCFSKLKKQVAKVKEPFVTAPYLVDVVAAVDLKKLKNDIRYEVAKKLTFIQTSNNMRREDLEDEVREMLIHVFYKIVPFKEGTYRHNFLKKSIHNIVLKRLYHYNTKKRQRLKGDGGKHGYVCVVESFSNTEDGKDDEKSNVMINSAIHPDYSVLNKMSVKSYIDNGPTGRGRIVSLLCLQSKEDDFVTFAKSFERIRAVDDCEDIYDRIGFERYYNLIAHYLCVPLSVVNRVSKDLQTLLG